MVFVFVWMFGAGGGGLGVRESPFLGRVDVAGRFGGGGGGVVFVFTR